MEIESAPEKNETGTASILRQRMLFHTNAGNDRNAPSGKDIAFLNAIGRGLHSAHQQVWPHGGPFSFNGLFCGNIHKWVALALAEGAIQAGYTGINLLQLPRTGGIDFHWPTSEAPYFAGALAHEHKREHLYIRFETIEGGMFGVKKGVHKTAIDLVHFGDSWGREYDPLIDLSLAYYLEPRLILVANAQQGTSQYDQTYAFAERMNLPIIEHPMMGGALFLVSEKFQPHFNPREL